MIGNSRQVGTDTTYKPKYSTTMPFVHITWLPKTCRNAAVRKQVADAVIKVSEVVCLGRSVLALSFFSFASDDDDDDDDDSIRFPVFINQ